MAATARATRLLPSCSSTAPASLTSLSPLRVFRPPSAAPDAEPDDEVEPLPPLAPWPLRGCGAAALDDTLLDEAESETRCGEEAPEPRGWPSSAEKAEVLDQSSSTTVTRPSSEPDSDVGKPKAECTDPPAPFPSGASPETFLRWTVSSPAARRGR